MGRIFNRRDQNNKRQTLRNSMSQAEIILWEYLKGKKLKNLKFRRQFSADRYVIDFYCPKKKLAIEVDGDSH